MGNGTVLVIGIALGVLAMLFKNQLLAFARDLIERPLDWYARKFQIGPHTDAVTKKFKKYTVFWPISSEAKTWMKTNLQQFPRRRGGYAVPHNQFLRYYNAYHHSASRPIIEGWATLGSIPVSIIEIDL